MSGASLIGRYVLAILAAATVGSMTLATIAAGKEAISAANQYFTPSELFKLTFAYSLLLSLPVVALALPLLSAVTNRIVLAKGVYRWILVLLIGLVSGVVLSSLIAPMFLDGMAAWFPPAIGLIWGLTSAAAGLIILREPGSGEQIG